MRLTRQNLHGRGKRRKGKKQKVKRKNGTEKGETGKTNMKCGKER